MGAIETSIWATDGYGVRLATYFATFQIYTTALGAKPKKCWSRTKDQAEAFTYNLQVRFFAYIWIITKSKFPSSNDPVKYYRASYTA